MPPKDPNAVEDFGIGDALLKPFSNLGNIADAAKEHGGEASSSFLQSLMSIFSGEGTLIDKIGALFSMLFKPVMEMLGLGGGSEVAQTAPQTPTAPTAPEKAPAPEAAPTVAPQANGILQQFTSTAVNEVISTIPLPDMIKQPLAQLVISNVNEAAATHLPALQNTQQQKIPS